MNPEWLRNRDRTPSNATLEVAPSPDIATLETAGESLMRLGDPKNAVALFAMALRLRMEAEYATS